MLGGLAWHFPRQGVRFRNSSFRVTRMFWSEVSFGACHITQAVPHRRQKQTVTVVPSTYTEIKPTVWPHKPWLCCLARDSSKHPSAMLTHQSCSGNHLASTVSLMLPFQGHKHDAEHLYHPLQTLWRKRSIGGFRTKFQCQTPLGMKHLRPQCPTNADLSEICLAGSRFVALTPVDREQQAPQGAMNQEHRADAARRKDLCWRGETLVKGQPRAICWH